MSSLHFQEQNKKKKSGAKGFYIALGVCLIAIGIASWTTYDSIVSFMEPEDASNESETVPAPVQNTVSGITVETPEESSVPTVEMEESSQPEPEPSSEPEPEPEEPAATQETSAVETAVTPFEEEEEPVYQYPVGETVTKNFSGNDPIYSETMQDWRVHRGVDLEAKIGDVVCAIEDGTVKESYQDTLLGNTLVIEHDGGVTAYYCGLGDTLLVKEGDEVVAGQDIGSVNTVPVECAERSHLHLELEKDGVAVDPLSLLQGKE